jgi:hypothetical protein
MKYGKVLRGVLTTAMVGALLTGVPNTASAALPQPGAYRLLSSDNGARIIPVGFNINDTVNVLQYRPEVHNAEVWNITRSASGYYRFQNANRCLQPHNGQPSVDQHVQLTTTCQATKTQEWVLTEEVPGRYLIAPRNNTNLVIAPEVAGSADTWLLLKERVASHDRLWLFDTEDD